MRLTARGMVDIGGRQASVLPSALREKIAEAARLLEEAGQPGALELAPGDVRPGPRPGTAYISRRAEERILAAAARVAAIREEQERAARREAATALVAAAKAVDPARWAAFEAAPRAAQEAVAALRRPDGHPPAEAVIAGAYLWPDRTNPGLASLVQARLKAPLLALDPTVATELAALVASRAIIQEEWWPVMERLAAGASPTEAAAAARAERKAREAAELEAERQTRERWARQDREEAWRWVEGLEEPLRSILVRHFKAAEAEHGLAAAGDLARAQIGIQRAFERGYRAEDLLEACGGPDGLWAALQEWRRPYFHYEGSELFLGSDSYMGDGWGND